MTALTLYQKAQKIKLLALDVDGVLSDGRIFYNAQHVETKTFYVQDGVGLKALASSGIILAIITGRVSPMVQRRADELGIHHVIQGREDKFLALSELAQMLGLKLDECAYMGDDLPDLKAIREAGVGISVPNGCDETRQMADFITTRRGGNGAVREACEMILKSQGKYDAMIAKYL